MAPARVTAKLSSLDRGLQIAACVQDRGPVSAAEIVDLLGIPQSSTYRYLRELVTLGFLVEVNRQFVAGERLADRTSGGPTHLLQLARPILHEVRAATGLTTVLTVRVHSAALCLDVVRVDRGVLTYRPGEILPMHAGASATALLAMAPASVQGAVLAGPLQQFTAATPDRVALRAALTDIRRDGYAVSHGWHTPGITAVGVPVMVADRCLCALSVIGADQSLRDERAAARLLTDRAGSLAQLVQRHDGTSWRLPDDTVAPEEDFR